MTNLAVPATTWKIIVAIRYAYPGIVLLYFIIASTVSVCILQTISSRAKDERVRRGLIIWLVLSVICLYIIHAVFLLLRPTIQADWTARPDEVVYLLSSALVWGLQFLALLDSKFPVWYPYYVNWIAAVIVETGLLVGSSILQKPVRELDYISISIQCARICNFISLYCTYVLARGRNEKNESEDEERQALLRSEHAPRTSVLDESSRGGTEYGATTGSSSNGSKKKTDDEEASEDPFFKRQREGADKVIKRLEVEGSWWSYCKAFFVFFPFIWPMHSKSLQFRAVLTGACLLTTNSLNLLVPRQLGVVIDALVTGNGGYVWTAVAIYAVLNFINSNACIGWLQFWLWQPLDQYSYEAINAAAHAHVMSLSSEFHESRTSGDIHQTISQGKGIRRIVHTLFFDLIPTFIDLFLVFVYLHYLFGPYMALNLAATTIFYLYTTAKLVEFAAQRRRVYHTFFRKEWMSALSSVGNWRVASYFNQIPYEHNQHHTNIKAHLRSEKSYDAVYHITSVSQNLVMTIGLLGACLLAVYQVLHKTRSPGDFIILLTYWAQLRAPLATFSTLYKTLSEGLMDAERMLEIFQTEPKVADRDDAKPLNLTKGEIQFKDVIFAYDDRKETLKQINLKIDGGSTVAIVGETGSGKSTILKLLHRFYDVKDGSIEIDGQDIRKITTKSLRENIAVVPQEPTLFNETIMSNLRYAQLSATDDEVYEACKSAEIHDKILSMPNSYDYKIGTTAAKLSGGEQQRLAIARAILKNSAIVLLDEATSAVDTETEQKIQEALNRLCNGRTTIIVAHRLSTIMRADHIVVMKDGSIIEHGSHEYLLRLKGKYFDLWANQIALLNPDDKSSSRSLGSRPASLHKDKVDVRSSRGRSKSPQKDKVKDESLEVMPQSIQNDKADIVNDLGLERNQVELIKLANMEKTIHQPGSAVTPETSKHPRLKANAPSFYPRHLRSDTGSGEEAFVESNKEMKKREEKTRRSHASLAKKATKNAGKSRSNLSDIEEPRNDTLLPASSITPEGSQKPAAMDMKDAHPKSRRPRKCSQRHISKSGPAGQDGTNDYEDQLAFSSGESQSLLRPGIMHDRRIIAPSDPIPNQQESRNSTMDVRPRRTRHWRIKNRQSSDSGSASTSAVASSVDASMDEATLPNPPNTSPAGGIQPAGIKVLADSK